MDSWPKFHVKERSFKFSSECYSWKLVNEGSQLNKKINLMHHQLEHDS